MERSKEDSTTREDVIAFRKEDRYEPDIEQSMRDFYNSLSEKDRRRYAAIEAKKLRHGGIRYIAQVLGCDVKTVAGGLEEIPELADGDPLAGRVRAEGAGRPKKR